MAETLASRIPEAARGLREHGAREVYVFGSAACGGLREDSGVDMAVTGLPAAVFFQAWPRAVRCFPGREMDLVDLDAGGPFVERLKARGELRRVE